MDKTFEKCRKKVVSVSCGYENLVPFSVVFILITQILQEYFTLFQLHLIFLI